MTIHDYNVPSPWSIHFELGEDNSLDNLLVTVFKSDVDIGRVRISWVDLPFPKVFSLARNRKMAKVVDILAEFGRLVMESRKRPSEE